MKRWIEEKRKQREIKEKDIDKALKVPHSVTSLKALFYNKRSQSLP